MSITIFVDSDNRNEAQKFGPTKLLWIKPANLFQLALL